jgi:hypothetical protein
LLMYFGMIALSILMFILWARLVPDSLILFGFLFVVLASLGGYFLWIYILLVGFNKLDIKNNYKNDFKKSQALLIATLLIFFTLIVFIFLYLDKEKSGLFFILSILMSTTLPFLFFETVSVLTKKFKFYDKKTRPNLWDYFITMFSLSFFPFGILMLHSHLRLILKDQLGIGR